jgi:hypothetical protein
VTDDEIRQLLAAVTAYDNRKVGGGMIAAWSEAARRGQWTYDEALDAVHAHYARQTSYAMPGHITEHIRAQRRAESDRVHSRQVAADAHRVITAGGNDPDEGRRNSPELESLHTEAMTVPCRRCGAEVGARCRNQLTGNATKIPHTPRSIAARDQVEADGRRSVLR